jgi:Domain of unknown function (DUF5666)
MPVRLFATLLFACALCAATAQEPPAGSPPSQGGWQGRGGRSGMMGMGRGTVGTVTEVAADHYTIKTDLGEVYAVHFSVNTRMMKQPPAQARRNEDAPGERTPPTPIKPADIKVGDVIAASGEVDADAKTVGAVFVMLIDPERAKQMRAMEANFGKTWLAGRVTAINEVKVTLQGGPDNAVHSFVADENTTFRKRRDPITLADIQVGDLVRVEGEVKSGSFVATNVAVMAPQPSGGPNHGAHVEGQPPPQ